MTKDELLKLAESWPDCEYWDTDETCESLTYSGVLEALEDAIDRLSISDNRTLEEDIKAAWPESLTIYGWTRKKVSEQDIQAMADTATQAVLEYFSETLEMSDPEDDTEPDGLLPDGFKEVIRKDMEARHVWGCDQTHEIELTTDQVVGIARLEWPEWFEEKVDEET